MQTTDKATTESPPRAGREIAAVLILVGIGIAAFAAYSWLPMFRLSALLHEEGMKHLSDLESLSPQKVERVDVFDRYGEKLLVTTDDASKLSAFVEAAKEMDNWVPNHPSFVRQLYVVLRLKDGQEQEFNICFKRAGAAVVYVYGVRKEGDATYYLYRRKSPALAIWLRNEGVGG